MAQRAPRATSTRLRKLMHFKASALPASRLRCWPHCMERARGKPCHWRARKWHCLLPGLPYLEPPFLRGPSGLITDSSRPSLSPRLSGERCCWRLSVSGELGGLALSGEAGGLPLPPPSPGQSLCASATAAWQAAPRTAQRRQQRPRTTPHPPGPACCQRQGSLDGQQRGPPPPQQRFWAWRWAGWHWLHCQWEGGGYRCWHG